MSASVPALAQAKADKPAATRGKMLYSSDGKAIAPVYRVDSDGSVDVIVESRLVTIAASTLSVTNGKVSTSLTKDQVLSNH